jgi:prephenate dehydratase
LGALRWRYPQAFGQCQKFITAHLPEARLISIASTAAAAEMVSTQDEAAADSAAICSKICLRLFADLEILHEGIQAEHSELNSTSFFFFPRGGFPFWDLLLRSSFLFLFQFKFWIER